VEIPNVDWGLSPVASTSSSIHSHDALLIIINSCFQVKFAAYSDWNVVNFCDALYTIHVCFTQHVTVDPTNKGKLKCTMTA
jgi:hypothetical protein